MKPNGEELASFTGADAALLESDPRAAAKAARTLVDRGVGAVLATLGAQRRRPGHPRGRVARRSPADHRRQHGWCRRLEPVRLRPRRALRDLAPPDRLALAVAYGSAAAGLPGTTIPEPGQVRPELVAVEAPRRKKRDDGTD